MQTWKKVLITFLIAWLLVFCIDIITSITIHRPIFSISGSGDCFQPYFGLGYSITFFDGPTPTGFYYDKVPDIKPWFYLVINTVLIFFVTRKKHIKKV